MRPNPTRTRVVVTAACAAACLAVTVQSVVAAKDPPKAAQGAAVVGGAIPGGAVISAAVSSVSNLGGSGSGAAAASYAATGRVALTPPGDGKTVESDIADDGTFSFKGLKPGTYLLRISMNPTVPKQTQGATFGEKVNQGMATGGTAKSKHDTAKNSVGNIRARENNQAGGVSVASGDVTGDGHERSDMPNRLSMNVTVPRQNLVASADGEYVEVVVGGDGALTGRATVQQAQGAEPATSGPDRARPSAPDGGSPPRPSGG